MALRKRRIFAGDQDAVPGPTSAGRIQVDSDAAGNEYAESREAGHKVDPRLQVIFVASVILVAVFFVGLIIPKHMFDTALWNSGSNQGYSLAVFLQQLQENVSALIALVSGNDAGLAYIDTIMLFAVVAVSGACMALSGAVFQGTFRNALVTPSTLGVMSGATLGMVLWVVFFVAEDGSNVVLTLYEGASENASRGDVGIWESLWQSYSIAIFSFAGCIIIVAISLLIFRMAKGAPATGLMMIIAGQVVAAVAGAITGSIRYYYVSIDPTGAKAELIRTMQIASFYRSFTLIDLFAIGVPLIVVVVVIMHYRQKLMLLSLSEGEARSLGVENTRFRTAIIALVTLLTAITVSFIGHVGFVGFLVPHMARRLVGPNLTYLLPASMVIGAVFVLASYVLVYALLGPAFQTMAGMFISIFGASVFLITALRGKGGTYGRFE